MEKFYGSRRYQNVKHAERQKREGIGGKIGKKLDLAEH